MGMKRRSWTEEEKAELLSLVIEITTYSHINIILYSFFFFFDIRNKKILLTGVILAKCLVELQVVVIYRVVVYVFFFYSIV